MNNLKQVKAEMEKQNPTKEQLELYISAFGKQVKRMRFMHDDKAGYILLKTAAALIYADRYKNH